VGWLSRRQRSRNKFRRIAVDVAAHDISRHRRALGLVRCAQSISLRFARIDLRRALTADLACCPRRVDARRSTHASRCFPAAVDRRHGTRCASNLETPHQHRSLEIRHRTSRGRGETNRAVLRYSAIMTSDPASHGYRSPLETRNASVAMRTIWSDHHRFTTWRQVWLALAQSQMELSLGPTSAQVEAIRRVLNLIDLDAAAKHEQRLRHDVMAHVHTLGDQATAARAILHLGATSQDVVCNADALLQREALTLIATRLARVIDRLGSFAKKWRELPVVGFTHYQAAQPLTMGRRATLWAQEFTIALGEIEMRIASLKMRGLRGATGTQASFLTLCGGDPKRVDQLERRFAEIFWGNADALWPLTSQTYPRLWDAQMLSSLAVSACAVHKCANDIRLLCNLREVDEPFEAEQIGSSAMPYKRNPMRCERATGLARFVISLTHNAYDTASTQWLERTLDDSSNRRLSIPESFLALDGALEVMANVAGGLVVYPGQCAARLQAEMPFMATEEILLAAVARGVDRQVAHESLRRHSQAAAQRIKGDGAPNDLLSRLEGDPLFQSIDMNALMNAQKFIGRSVEQTDSFLHSTVDPIRARYATALQENPDLRV